MAEIRTTSSTGGQKGTKLERYDLIPVGPLAELAEHYGIGASKYANHQWRKGYEWSKSYAALMRHVQAFWDGKDYDVCSNDPEGCSHVDTDGEPFTAIREDACFNHTGSHHMAAVAWHAFLLLEFKDRFPEHDDRYDPNADGDGSIYLAPLEPKTYGEALDRAVAEFADEVRSGEAYDREAWAIQAAAEDVARYGADAEYPCEGMSRKAWEAREAERAERSRQQAHRSRLALDGLEPEEPVAPGETVIRADVLGEGWTDLGYIDETFESPFGHLTSILNQVSDRSLIKAPPLDADSPWFKPVEMEITNVSPEVMRLAFGLPEPLPVSECFVVDIEGVALAPIQYYPDWMIVDVEEFPRVGVKRWVDDYDAERNLLRDFFSGPDLLRKHPTRWDRG